MDFWSYCRDVSNYLSVNSVLCITHINVVHQCWNSGFDVRHCTMLLKELHIQTSKESRA